MTRGVIKSRGIVVGGFEASTTMTCSGLGLILGKTKAQMLDKYDQHRVFITDGGDEWRPFFSGTGRCAGYQLWIRQTKRVTP